MIRVAKSNADKVGGCQSCNGRGPVLVIHLGQDGSNVTREVRLCSACASVMLAEMVRVDRAVAAPRRKTKKAKNRNAQTKVDALGTACPLCKVAAGERCIEVDGIVPSPEGVHFTRISEHHRGGPIQTTPTRVRDMAPHVRSKPSGNGTARRDAIRVPKPYKARRIDHHAT